MSTKEDLDKAVETYIRLLVANTDFQEEHGTMSRKLYAEMETAMVTMTEVGLRHFFPDRVGEK